MRWSSAAGCRRAAGLLAAVLLGIPGLGVAQERPRDVRMRILVGHISQEGGAGPESRDPDVRRLDRTLKRQFRYDRLKVLQKQDLSLRQDEVGQVSLPNGRRMRIRPLDVGERDVLMAVDVEGSVKNDARVRYQRMLVIGGDPYEDGKLVISIEPEKR